MLAHPDVNFSTFPAELLRNPCVKACNGWLQCRSMRIELPSASWADTVQRAEDDAHTLTVASAPATEWAAWQWATEPARPLRTQVSAALPVTVTLTF
jgi:hypothetical protein